MYNHSLAHDNGSDLITVCMDVIVEDLKSHTYPCTFHKTEEVLSELADVYSASVYA